MKKTLISVMALLLATPVLAAVDCAYSPLQNLIRNVRDVKEIENLINQGVIFSEKNRCGGSLMQLAILRGNSNVLIALLNQDPSRANEIVSLNGFSIPGTSKEVPLILFASYYAPNPDMIINLVKAGADISKTDSQGRNLLWYMDQNPVLRNTDLYDQLYNNLLRALVPTQQNRPMMPIGGTVQTNAMPTGIPVSTEKTEPQQPKASVVEATTN